MQTGQKSFIECYIHFYRILCIGLLDLTYRNSSKLIILHFFRKYTKSVHLLPTDFSANKIFFKYLKPLFIPIQNYTVRWLNF